MARRKRIRYREHLRDLPFASDNKDRDYFTAREMTKQLGLSRYQLERGSIKGWIRSVMRRNPSTKMPTRYYNYFDCVPLTWPNLYEICGRDRRLYNRYKYKLANLYIPGVRRIGHVYRIPPEAAARLHEWIAGGCKGKSPFPRFTGLEVVGLISRLEAKNRNLQREIERLRGSNSEDLYSKARNGIKP